MSGGYPSDEARKAAHARAAEGKTPKLRRVPLAGRKGGGAVLHRTGPHGAQEVRLLEDHASAASRIYELATPRGAVRLLGSELDSLTTWWQEERDRPGHDHPEEPATTLPLEDARQMGYADAWTQIGYVMQHGGTVEEGIEAHQAYRKVGDLFTDQHGDDGGFHRGAEEAYADARRKHGRRTP